MRNINHQKGPNEKSGGHMGGKLNDDLIAGKNQQEFETF